VTGSRDGTLTVWDPTTGHRSKRLARWREGAIKVASSADGKVLVSTKDPSAFGLWDLAAGRRLALPALNEEALCCAALSPDGRVLATGNSGGDVRLWATARGKELRLLRADNDDAVKTLAWATDSKTLAVSQSRGTVAAWDTETGRRKIIMRSEDTSTLALALSPDGRLLAMGRPDNVVRLYEVATGGEIRQFGRPPRTQGESCTTRGVQALAFAPDGRTLASGGGLNYSGFIRERQITFGNPATAVRLWGVRTGKSLRKLPGHQLPVHTLAFAPDGTVLFSGGEEDTVLCWEVADVTRRTTLAEDLPAGRLMVLWDDLASGTPPAVSKRSLPSSAPRTPWGF
jgi:WD40 repeat protein